MKADSGVGGAAGRAGEQGLLLAAGLADLALDQVEKTARGLRGLLRRSDLRELVDDGLGSLKARGELAVKRASPDSQPHLEDLARRAAHRQSPDA